MKFSCSAEFAEQQCFECFEVECERYHQCYLLTADVMCNFLGRQTALNFEKLFLKNQSIKNIQK